MRVLLLTQVVPYPPDSGPKVKTYYVLRYLVERGHRVTLATFVRAEEQSHLEGVKPLCEAVHAVTLRRSRAADVRAYAQSLINGMPFLVQRDHKPIMDGLVGRLTQEQAFDIVHADQLTMGQFALAAHGARRVFDAHNAVWTIVERARHTAPLPMRPVLADEARRLKRYEGWLCRQMDAVLAVSEVDRRHLLEAGAADRIQVVPISVDSTALRPVETPVNTQAIISVSTLYYPPNADGVRWFMRDVYPFVRKEVPAATITLIGARPPRDLAALDGSEGVRVPGYVADLQTHFAGAAVNVVPVRSASGMRVRILESLARGVPVVTTTTGLEGIEATNEHHVLVADTPVDFARAVIRLLREPLLRRQLAQNGRMLVEQKYDWHVTLPALDTAYELALRNVR